MVTGARIKSTSPNGGRAGARKERAQGRRLLRIARRAAVIGVALLALPVSRPLADAYPSRSVTIVAPSAPGGMYSILARLIGAKLERRYGKSFIVENRPGASSVTGAVAVTRSPPDRYTLMVATSSTMATNVTLPNNLTHNP